MSKNSRMTHITPLPASVTREAAVAHLHNHHQMIELNPLVLRHKRTEAPSNAAPEEAANMTWYEITDEIQYIPGTPIKGEVTYKAGFFDVANGLQTHTFAPGGVDIRGKWIVGGNAPGEEREEIEIGSKKPRDGLYIQEEVELRCNVFFTNFVKKNLKKSHSTVVDSIVEMAVGLIAEGKIEDPKPPHSRTDSEISSSKPSRRKAPTDAPGLASTPTSYSKTGPNPCPCPMAAFGVHMESCNIESQPQPQPPESHAPPESQSPPELEKPQPEIPQSETLQPSANDLTAELDGNPVAAQHYYQYQGGRAAELQGE